MAADEATRARWKQEVEREFSDPRYVAGFRTWQETTSRWFGPLTDRLLAAARLEPGLRVLDVGSGTGEPALTIAGRVGPGGAVVATDPSPDLLAIAVAHAGRAGLANLTCQRADVAALPFPDAAFDRVTCRLAAMYFLDPVAGLAEMRRVLKPGGRAAVLVWGDPGHAAYAAAFFGPIVSRVTLPEPEPGSPHPYRFAAPGSLRQAMEAAGFREVDEQVQLVPLQLVPLRFPGTAADFMRWFRDMAIPMDYIWETLGPQETERAVTEIVANMRPFEADGAVQTDLEVIIGTGIR